MGTDCSEPRPADVTRSILLSFLLLATALVPAPLPADVANYDHRRLLYFLDGEGAEQPVETADDWRKRRADIIGGMEAVMGKLPPRENLGPPAVRVVSSVEAERYVRQTITYEAEPGHRVPAFLYVPRELRNGQTRFPAMLALHPTSPLGKGVVDGQSDRPNRAYAKELAAHGFVVLAPDYPSFGDDQDYDFGGDRYASGTMKGVFNHIRGVDLLVARDDVDARRIGVIGHSLGGHNAVFAGALDERLKVVVTSCGWTPFHDYYDGKLDGWAQDRYMPLIRTAYGLDPDRMPFDFHEAVAAIAPRGFFTSSPLHDDNFAVAGVRKAMAEVRKVYELHDAGANLAAVYPDTGHDFPGEVREQAYEFIHEAFRRQ